MENEKKDQTVDDIIESIYHFKKWGEGYFQVAENGYLAVHPNKDPRGPSINFKTLIEDIKREELNFPVVVRFHDILQRRVRELNQTFKEVMEELEYQNRYLGVYPIKVNQTREVVEEVLQAGADFNYGLEAGSKPELLTVLAMNNDKQALSILNGYKDEDYFRLAMLGRKLDKKMIVVIEKYTELETLIRIAKEMDVTPMIGLRAKISNRGCGKWTDSCGENAKFGLTIAEILNALELVKREGLEESIKLLHFHIGSQIPNIGTIKDAITEAVRVFTEIYKMGLPLEYIDVGGGLAVDYDGSQSTKESSKNYDINAYAWDIVHTVKQICDLENVPHPVIVSESGRSVAAHHSMVITKVIDKIDSSSRELIENGDQNKEHMLVSNIREILDNIDEENFIESFNDAVFIKKETENAFKLGVLSLRQRGIIESHFWSICQILMKKAKSEQFIPEEFRAYTESLSSQYICNFSVFQSLPDSWAIDQLLPVAPVMRLKEIPEVKCSINDITCDSDGKIKSYINQGKTTNTIRLHELKKGEDYYLGFFLTGAYQDVMGDMHNLFGRVHEVHVYHDEDDDENFYIEEVVKGHKSKHVLRSMQYNPEYLAFSIKKEIDAMVMDKKVQSREGVKLVDFYEQCLESYTYLN